MNKIFVSVIIPTFNRAHLLPRAIDSVLKQTYRHFELIVVDDGSIDDTASVVAQYSDQLRYIRLDNQGVSHARNVGVAHAKGDWLAFLDSDDEYLQHRLEWQVNFIENHPQISLVHGEEIWIRNGVRVNPHKKHKKFGGRIFQKCLQRCLISPSAVIVKKDLLSSQGGFDENFVVCEDYDLWLKITARFEVGFIEKPIIVKYGGHQDQLSRKYVAMDYYRVKSMFALLQDLSLLPADREAVMNEILKKGKILMDGYRKHQNLENLAEIEKILGQVESLMPKSK